MKYPSWLPYPKAWGQAVALSIQLFIQGIPLSIAGSFWVEIFRDQGSVPTPIVILLLITAVCYPFLLIYLLSLVHQFLWDEYNPKFPKWFPRWRCWGEGLWGFLVMLVSTVLGLAIAFRIYEIFGQTDEQLLVTFSIAEIIVMAYCFHFRNLISRKFSGKKPGSQKQKINVEPQANIDPIEVELNKIKAEFGLKQMNDIKDSHKH